MKTNQRGFFSVAAAAMFLAAATFLQADLRAQAPQQTITVNSRRGPFTYRLGRDLHVVGLDGKPAKISAVRVGQKVTVYYYLRDGQETVARIVVLEAAKKGR